MEDDVFVGTCKNTDVYLNLNLNANRHMLLTGSTGTGKTNFLKNFLEQINASMNFILDYSCSFENYGDAVFRNILETAEIQDFFANLNEETIGTIADAIQGAWRLGTAQRAAVVKALCRMMKPVREEAIMHTEDDLIKKYLEFQDGIARRSWALFAFLMNTECGAKGEQIATRMIDIVYKLFTHSKDKAEDTAPDCSNVIIQFPIENSGLNSQLVELFLWKLWLRQIKERKPIFIVLDECQDLLWKKGSISERLVSEGRKFGIGLILSTQFVTNNFPKRVITNFMQSGVRVIFAPPESEVKEIAQSLDYTSWKNWQKCLRNLRVGSCVISGNLRFGQRTSKQKLMVDTPEYIRHHLERR